MVNPYSNLLRAFKLHTKDATEIVRILREHFTSYPVPKEIGCDNGSEFKNELLDEVLELLL
jgi:hypothetical protein